MPAIAQGRQRAGKTLEGFEIVTAVPLAITHERTPALAAFRAELTRYLQLPFYRAMLERAGLGDGLRPSTVTARRPPRSPRPWVPGTVEAARALVQAYREAGVTLPAVRPIVFPTPRGTATRWRKPRVAETGGAGARRPGAARLHAQRREARARCRPTGTPPLSTWRWATAPWKGWAPAVATATT